MGLGTYFVQRNWGARLREFVYHGLRLIVLENERLRVGVLAGKGTDVEGAAITFTGCATVDGTYRAIKTNAGVAVSAACTTGTSEIITLDDPTVFAGIPFIKVVMGTNQTGVGTLELYTIPV